MLSRFFAALAHFPHKPLIILRLAVSGNGHPVARLLFVLMLARSVMQVSRHCAGEELIPLLGDSKRVDTPELEIVTREDGAVAWLHGRIDIDSSPALHERLLAILHGPHPEVVSIDLSAVNQIGSSGVATLIDVLRIARGSGTELRLQGLHDRLLRLFEFTGILGLFNGKHSEVGQSGCEAV